MIYNTCRIYYIHAFREGSSFRPASSRSEVPCWQQQLECEWKISEVWGRCSRISSQLASNNVLPQPSVLFSVGLRTKLQVPNFQVYGDTADENIMNQQPQKIWREKVCRINAYRENLWKFGQNIFCAPKLSAPEARSQVLRFGVAKYIFRGEDFCSYYIYI